MKSYRTRAVVLDAPWSTRFGEAVALDDPAELYHVASELSPHALARELPRAVAPREPRPTFGAGALAAAQVAALVRAGSAAGVDPLETYVVAFAAAGLAAGLYRCDPLGGGLAPMRSGDLRGELLAALPERELAAGCALALIVSAVFGRARAVSGQRGYRCALLAAGRLVQNVLLAADAAGLAAAPTAHFYDRRLAAFLALDGVDAAPLYVVPIGVRA